MAENKGILRKENILLNCEGKSKEEAIRELGQALVSSGYVEEDYVEGMLQREETFATYMGNGIALPHGVESAKKSVKASGIAVMTFPNGIDWSGDEAKIVIAVAGQGDEHLAILSNVAVKLMDEEAVAAFLKMNEDEVYEFLSSEEDL